MVELKSCPRCHGDMILETWLDDYEVVCLQCGHRLPAPPPEAARPLARPKSRAT